MEPSAAPIDEVSPRDARTTRFLLAAALGLFVVLALPGALRESQTYDEGAFFTYGYQVLATGDFARDGTTNSKMPWNAVQVAPSYLLERAGRGPAFARRPGSPRARTARARPRAPRHGSSRASGCAWA